VLGNRALDAGKELGLDAQYEWCNDDVRVPALFEYLVANAHDYRALVFAPYLYWTSVAGTLAAPERTVLLPCLHDEPAARLDVFAREFRDVRGLWFLTDPEAELARQVHADLADAAVIGSGVDVPDGYEPERFRTKFGIHDPFVLYVGRREAGKDFEGFVDDFLTATRGVDETIRLVVAGPGRVRVADSARGQVVDVGVLDTTDRNDAMAAASAVVQPSPYESFSRTMMEAWLAGAFVIANGKSAVSAWHCARASAGATYFDVAQLVAALRRISDPSTRGDGARGRAYVLREYTWPTVLDRVEGLVADWFPVVGR
jgi:glycosyltransferase involved in cell wall biosynthesis